MAIDFPESIPICVAFAIAGGITEVRSGSGHRFSGAALKVLPCGPGCEINAILLPLTCFYRQFFQLFSIQRSLRRPFWPIRRLGSLKAMNARTGNSRALGVEYCAANYRQYCDQNFKSRGIYTRANCGSVDGGKPKSKLSHSTRSRLCS
jgi:hypothetical protein